MKRFCIKLLIVMIPIVLFAIAMEILLRQIPNDYTLKREYLDEHSNEIETLILGSSHTFRGLDPVYFTGKAFNASLISQTFEYDKAILEKYADDWQELNTVILPLSYPSLFVTLSAGDEPWRIKNYTIYFKLKVSRKLKDYTEVLSNNASVIRDRLELYYLKDRSNVTSSELGWGEIYLSKKPQDLDKAGLISSERHTKDDLSLFDENMQVLESIIEFCGQRNVNVLLFTPPAYKSYRDNLNAHQLDLTVRSGKNLASRFANCTYVDLMADTSFIKTDYFDADHMNEAGAKKLSLRVNKLIAQ